MTTDNFHFYLQNRLIQTCQTGGQLYSDTSSFSFPWSRLNSDSKLESNRLPGIICPLKLGGHCNAPVGEVGQLTQQVSVDKNPDMEPDP
jgi:hypothetical protein